MLIAQNHKMRLTGLFELWGHINIMQFTNNFRDNSILIYIVFNTNIKHFQKQLS